MASTELFWLQILREKEGVWVLVVEIEKTKLKCSSEGFSRRAQEANRGLEGVSFQFPIFLKSYSTYFQHISHIPIHGVSHMRHDCTGMAAHNEESIYLRL